MLTANRWRAAAGAILALAAADVIGLVVVWPGSADGQQAAPPPPTARASTVTPAPSTPAPSTSRLATTSSPPARTARANTVAIPSQGVVAPVDVCQIVNDELEPPANVHRTCRWAGGAALDAKAGTTVITGHINYVGQGTGALGNIDRLQRGNTVITAGADGAASTWRVVSVVHWPKTSGIDRAAFVGAAGPRQLYLISCGGAFDAADRSYVDNIYVRAVPA